MDDLSHLPAKSQGQLLRTIEAGSTILHRGEFFLWAQGQLQSVLPHGVLLAASLDGQLRMVHLECLQGIPLPPDVLKALTDPHDGWLVRASRLPLPHRALGHCELDVSDDASADGGTTAPPANDQAALDGSAMKGLFRQLHDMKVAHAMVARCGPLPGGGMSIFALLGMPAAAGLVQGLVLRTLVPQLHLALSKSQAWRPPEQRELPEDEDEWELTDRQLEILHWVKLGKTNFEIAQILDISALTVKNHLQKMFKKLNVHNRAQAVAKSMALSLPMPQSLRA